MRYVSFLSLASLLVAARLATAQPAASPLWGDLEPGPYAVGFTYHYIFDDSRSYIHPDSAPGAYQGRPIRILVWYPTEDTVAPLMSFADYFELEPADPRFARYYEVWRTLDGYTAQSAFDPPDGQALHTVMTTATTARRDAPPADGRFPLILHSLGLNNYQQENTVLWEYLASHGFVVGVIPHLGPDPSRRRLTVTLADLEIQKRDLGFALAQLVRTGCVDATRVGLIGYSWGSGAAFLLALENRNVDALASLDGVITAPDVVDLLESLDWDPEAVTLPILNIYARTSDWGPDLDLVESLSSARVYHVALGARSGRRQAIHWDFQNWPLFSALVQHDNPRATERRPRELGAAFYRSMCRMTRAFFDTVLKGDSEALRTLAGVTPFPGLDPGLIEIAVQEGGARR